MYALTLMSALFWTIGTSGDCSLSVDGAVAFAVPDCELRMSVDEFRLFDQHQIDFNILIPSGELNDDIVVFRAEQYGLNVLEVALIKDQLFIFVIKPFGDGRDVIELGTITPLSVQKIRIYTVWHPLHGVVRASLNGVYKDDIKGLGNFVVDKPVYHFGIGPSGRSSNGLAISVPRVLKI